MQKDTQEPKELILRHRGRARWLQSPAAPYFGSATGMPPRAALYAPGFDRFLVVEEVDLWSAFHAAKLLNSKIPLLPCALGFSSPLNNANCLLWSLAERNIRLSTARAPLLRLLDQADGIFEAGPPDLAREALGDLLHQQEFALFLLRATTALRLTEAHLNSTDHPFYTRFFSPLEGGGEPLKAFADGTKWPLGFRISIEKILYQSSSTEEALQAIRALFPAPARMNSVLAEYAKVFFRLLEGAGHDGV